MTDSFDSIDMFRFMDDQCGTIKIGLDLGSSGTRVVVNYTKDKIFASHGYPFDDQGPVYMSEARLANRESVSLKYAFYILANASDRFVDQCPMLQKLRQHDSEDFRQKLRTGILELLKTVRRWILANMRKHWKIDRLSVGMPAQWGLEFQRVFLALIGEAFEEEPYVRSSKPVQVWLVIEHGGHNLNGALFRVEKRHAGPPRFYRFEDAFGACGGSEHLLHNILAAFQTKCLDPPVGCQGPARPMSPFIAEQIRKQFSKTAVRKNWGPQLYNLGEEQQFTFTVRLEEHGEVIRCTFDQAEIDQAWNDAHKATFELVKNLLEKLRKSTTDAVNGTIPEAVICIAGGSTRSDPWRRKVSAMIRTANLPMAVFI
ncbi:hypothetical protein QR685DRAFT_547960 [Neurospora intermedia]|uniref:Uncharacterized protein n=1 Tax=Neurospora intermedia TaxID=5142 RepID=A0ABR3D106_NEUIN